MKAHCEPYPKSRMCPVCSPPLSPAHRSRHAMGMVVRGIKDSARGLVGDDAPSCSATSQLIVWLHEA